MQLGEAPLSTVDDGWMDLSGFQDEPTLRQRGKRREVIDVGLGEQQMKQRVGSCLKRENGKRDVGNRPRRDATSKPRGVHCRRCLVLPILAWPGLHPGGWGLGGLAGALQGLADRFGCPGDPWWREAWNLCPSSIEV